MVVSNSGSTFNRLGGLFGRVDASSVGVFDWPLIYQLAVNLRYLVEIRGVEANALEDLVQEVYRQLGAVNVAAHTSEALGVLWIVPAGTVRGIHVQTIQTADLAGK